ncbi:MAG: lysophospholipid acyltransferase family protein [Mangrovibacterium sp.]
MKLVNPKDILRPNPFVAYTGGDNLAKFILYALRFKRLNRIYGQIGDKEGIAFVEALINALEISYRCEPSGLKRIPRSGPVMVVSNHPFGGLDAILLIRIIGEIRPDVRVMTDCLLKRIEPVSGFFLAANEPGERKTGNSTLPDSAEALEHLNHGGVLVVFPSGEGASSEWGNKISDRLWQYPVLKFVRKAGVPVVPVHVNGDSGLLLRLVGRLYPNLRKGRLPSELQKKRKKPVKVRIGTAIPVKEQNAFPEIYQFGRYLRARTFSLNSAVEVKPFFNYSLFRRAKPEPVVDARPAEQLLQELEGLEDYLLFRLKHFAIYCSPSSGIPTILHEIGRLRELTFREVGEGTNAQIDLDEFDLYYHQLFIWDEQACRLVGAYRIGKGSDILHAFGTGGFYVQSLFRIKEGFMPVLRQSLELGRSFVVKDYQRQSMPLFLLWKGILYFLLKNPEYRYLLGPVSISSNYSRVSRDMIIRFIMLHHFDWDMARLVAPRKAFRFKSQDPEMNVIMENMEDINKLDKFIGDVDEMNSGLPVLLKKYIKLNARIIGFNLDPKFNNCLDGLILLDVYDVPKNVIESLSKEVNDGSILNRFYFNRE